ncbi:hypothetical protein ACFV1N_48395 [Streptosporangium canum]|uniref:hypothetical protein n=1 Tax=Streptosporangium canum TaxID=324952 RepID=UPI00367C11B6
MLITLEPGTDRGNVLQMLRQVLAAAENLNGRQDKARELHVAYLEWVNTACGQLRRQISSADLDRLVTTDRYSTVLSMQITPPTVFLSTLRDVDLAHVTGPIREMLSLEISEHIHNLRQALATLTTWSQRLPSLAGSGETSGGSTLLSCK